MTDWEDATKLSNYVEKVRKKVEDYGLDYPNLNKCMNENELKEKEDQLVEFFLEKLR